MKITSSLGKFRGDLVLVCSSELGQVTSFSRLLSITALTGMSMNNLPRWGCGYIITQSDGYQSSDLLQARDTGDPSVDKMKVNTALRKGLGWFSTLWIS